MKAPLAVVQLALAALALLGAVAVLAVRARSGETPARGPQPVGSYTALVGSSSPGLAGHHTACGGVLGPDTEGIAHPTLPCGVRLFVTYGGRTVLAQVIDRGPYGPGRQFDVTAALARRLQLTGIRVVHWSYARGS